jgi:hypothetical protein
MKPTVVDMGISDQDEIMGAIWSRHCVTPFHDAILVGDDILLVNSDGDVTSGISCMTIRQFGADA